jgi:hypothetical protein
MTIGSEAGETNTSEISFPSIEWKLTLMFSFAILFLVYFSMDRLSLISNPSEFYFFKVL